MSNIASHFVLAAAMLFSVCDKSQDSNSEQALWGKLDSLGDDMPLTKPQFESILGATTFLMKQGSYVSTWRGEPVILGSDLGIVTPEIKLGNDGRFSDLGGVSLDITGKCITFEQVKAKYGDLTVFDTPRGHSFMDETVYRSRQKWGSYYFAFRVIARDCLASISLSTDAKEFDKNGSKGFQMKNS